MLGLREAIEVGAATLAADRAGADDLALMRTCVERMDGAAEFDDYHRADVGFHMAIARASGVPRLVTLMTEVHSEVSELIAHIAHPPEVLAHSNTEHAKIVDAIGRGRRSPCGDPYASSPGGHRAHPRRALPAGRA